MCVLTIDPARRLADALGLAGGLTNEPARVDVAGVEDQVGRAELGQGGLLLAHRDFTASPDPRSLI